MSTVLQKPEYEMETFPISADDQSSFSILLVENHADGAESLAYLFGLYGWNVTVASSCEYALAIAAEPPDALLIEVSLRNSIDLIRHFRSMEESSNQKRSGQDFLRVASETLIIAVTSSNAERNRARARDAGVDLYLLKPAEPKAIVAALRNHPKNLRAGERRDTTCRNLETLRSFGL